tara:strand:- start:397 stop:792 length:396 start_codon:yes stop_codon:yes gene_type:complete
MFGIKRLTKNDHSWLESDSTSHQAGVNLPLGQFEDMFPEIVGFEDNPRIAFKIHWHHTSGDLYASTSNEVVWYQSKRELRLLHVGQEAFGPIADTGNLLVIVRNENILEIFVMPAGSEKVLAIMGLEHRIP